MKRLFIVSLAVIGLAACTSNPYKPAAVEPRKPSNLGGASADSVSNVSDASVGFAANTIHASINVSKVVSNAAEDVAASDNGILGPFSTSAKASAQIAVIGWDVSKKASILVVTSASETSKLAQASVNQVVTTSGEIFNASVDASKTAIRVSVDLAEGSKDLIVYAGKSVVGTVKLSAKGVSDVAQWTSDKSVNAVTWSVDKFGRLYTGSKEVVGSVLDTSGDVVTFVLDKSGKILTIASDVSVAVVQGSGNLISDLAKDAASASKDASKFLVGTVVSSAQKSVVYVKWSGHQSGQSSKFVFNSIRNLLHSTPEERPSVPVPGSAAAPGSSSQSN